MSNYPWHPLHPPAPSNNASSARIALIGPIGKCLQDALDELCEQDRSLIDDASISSPNKPADVSPAVACNVDEFKSSLEQDAMDPPMVKSILERYAHSVVNTNFDSRSKKQEAYTAIATTSTTSNQSTTLTTAPAALLKGKIHHYNRIGGQWRIVVTNATLIPRNVCADGNGRKRSMLDWNDRSNGDENSNDDSNFGCTKKRRADGTEVYRFKGSIQVLAYDDDT